MPPAEPPIGGRACFGLLAFIIDLNLRRRHLNESQRAMVAAELATMQQGARTDIAQICAISDAQAAKLLNVSEPSVETAKAVKRDATPEVVKLVEDGKLAVSAAWRSPRPSRHMGKGALAMVAACMFPDPEKGGRGKKGSVSGTFSGVDFRRLAEARTVLALAPDLVARTRRRGDAGKRVSSRYSLKASRSSSHARTVLEADARPAHDKWLITTRIVWLMRAATPE